MVAVSSVHIQTKRFQAVGGAQLAYHVLSPKRLAQAASTRLPAVVLANGLGGPHTAWAPLASYLGDRYRFITWDYRGLYGSDRPGTGATLDDYAVERHVDDLFRMLERENVTEASLIGWSMGVQVCLEAYARDERAFRSLVLLNGTFGRPLDTVVPTSLAKHVVPSAVDAARAFHRPAGGMLRLFATRMKAIRWLKRVGAMGETLDEEEFGYLVRSFGTLDVEAFAMNLRALGEHDASRILSRISAPVLVITGDRDRMTPRGLSQQMVRKIPRAEILVVRGGTHYTALEFPDLVNLRIERFFHEQGFV